MTKKTHANGGMLCSILGFMLLRQKGLLLDGVNEFLQWLVIYPFAYWGSTAMDLDHHWQSCPTHDYPSFIVYRLLHIGKPLEDFVKRISKKPDKNLLYKLGRLFNAHHRSWQTHSDLTLFLLVYTLIKIYSRDLVLGGTVDTAILTLVLTGLVIGTLAHLVLDMLTPEGITLIIPKILNLLLKAVGVKKFRIPDVLRLVPRRKFFTTGNNNTWEILIQKTVRFLTTVSLVWFVLTLVHPLIIKILPFTLSFGK